MTNESICRDCGGRLIPTSVGGAPLTRCEICRSRSLMSPRELSGYVEESNMRRLSILRASSHDATALQRYQRSV